jgi:hypothetical protein
MTKHGHRVRMDVSNQLGQRKQECFSCDHYCVRKKGEGGCSIGYRKFNAECQIYGGGIV